jgi:hypothetical protein
MLFTRHRRSAYIVGYHEWCFLLYRRLYQNCVIVVVMCDCKDIKVIRDGFHAPRLPYGSCPVNSSIDFGKRATDFTPSHVNKRTSRQQTNVFTLTTHQSCSSPSSSRQRVRALRALSPPRLFLLVSLFSAHRRFYLCFKIPDITRKQWSNLLQTTRTATTRRR